MLGGCKAAKISLHTGVMPMQATNLVIVVPADVPPSNDARASAGTMGTTMEIPVP